MMHKSKSKVPLAIGAAVVLCAGMILGSLVARSSKSEPEKSEAKALQQPIEAPAGTKVPLLLLERLESGPSLEGEKVRLCVAEDVSVNGRLAFEKGAEAEGEVSWSRRGDIGSSIANKPARLAIRVLSVQAVDGTRVTLKVENDQHEFKPENTTVDTADVPKIEEVLTEPEREALQAFSDRGLESLQDESTRRELESLLGRAKGLPNEAKKIRLNEILGAGRVASGDLSGLLAISNLAEAGLNGLAGMVKTKQVVAPVGCRILAETAISAKIGSKSNR